MISSKYIYKYRTYSNVSLKEILYGELFLSSMDEINDPYDTNVNFIFKRNYDRYERFIKSFINKLLVNEKLLTIEDAKNIQIHKIINLLNQSNLLYPDLINLISGHEFKNNLIEALSKCKSFEIISIADIFIRDLKQEIHKHLCKPFYISSFSMTYDEPIMWSHYAEYHKGFCLIFKVDDNKIFSKDNHDVSLKIEKVKYKTKIKEFDAFYNFNGYINGRSVSKSKVDKYWKDYKIAMLTKSIKWRYEEEAKIMKFLEPRKVTSEGAVKSSIVERIFHYDQKQLIGVILGSKMNENSKNDLIDTIYQMRLNLLKSQELILPNFKIYTAQIRPNAFKLKTNIEKILDHSNSAHHPSKELELDQKYQDILKISRPKYATKRS